MEDKDKKDEKFAKPTSQDFKAYFLQKKRKKRKEEPIV